jgi:DNA polymerase-3 subunit epsilon
MNLDLKKPIVFFDLETTGVNVASDRIVEISILKIHPDGKKEVKTRRVNPEIKIPTGSSEIHGIYDEDVKDEPTFKSLAKSLATFIANSDLAGFNSNKFDVPLLMEEFLRVGIDFDLKSRKLVDVQNIFHKMEQRTLVAAYKFYCGQELINAHSAEADNTATYEVLKAQIEKYGELENNVDFLSEFSMRNKTADLMGRIVFNDKDVEVFNFGKHKGKPVSEVFEKEPSYYNWMMKGDFPLYTKKVLTEIKLRGFNNK